jgi:cytochrome c551/c552
MDKTILNMSQNNFSSCFSRLLFTIFLSVLFLNPIFSQNPPAAAGPDPMVQKGQALFKEAGCNTCHAVHEKKTGPALKDVTKRWSSQPTLISFVKNSTKVINSGDAYANKLYNEFGKIQMPAHEFLSDDDVKAILAYITAESKMAPGPAPATGGGDGKTTSVQPAAKDNSSLILTLIIVVLVLVLIALILVLVFVRRYLKDKETSLLEDEKEIVDAKVEPGKLFRSAGFIGIVIFIFVIVAVRSCWVGMMSIGVDQNYEPKQPIPFSHKLHAGQYKIDCNYCHTGVTKSKNANIPSINICMNCHSQIKEGPKYGKAGIAILLEHFEKQKPIEWVRVHSLPDFAYFNHSQHVKVGGVECQTCHGAIDTMEVVRQYSPLTMGWCINCHRETKVNGKDNVYYDKLYAKHKEMTVENIGGLECSKCHY